MAAVCRQGCRSRTPLLSALHATWWPPHPAHPTARLASHTPLFCRAKSELTPSLAQKLFEYLGETAGG